MRAQGPPELAELGDELLDSKGSKEQGAAASSGFGEDTSRSKRSLARCRQGRGRRQRRKGATTMMGPCAGWLSWWSPTAAGGDGIGREALLLSLSATVQRERRGSSASSPWQCGCACDGAQGNKGRSMERGSGSLAASVRGVRWALGRLRWSGLRGLAGLSLSH